MPYTIKTDEQAVILLRVDTLEEVANMCAELEAETGLDLSTHERSRNRRQLPARFPDLPQDQ